MKVAGVIFAFYILFLSIQPGLKAIAGMTSQNTETCCGGSCEPIEKKEPEKQSDKKDNTENDVCNPFQFCKYCIGFNTALAFQAPTPITSFAKLHAEGNEKVPPQIALDFWQPPKIA